MLWMNEWMFILRLAKDLRVVSIKHLIFLNWYEIILALIVWCKDQCLTHYVTLSKNI